MTKGSDDRADTAPIARELGPAFNDITYQLLYDPSDTRDNIDDAVAFAPLAAMKMVDRLARPLAVKPILALLGVAGIAVAALAILLARSTRVRRR